MPVSWVLYCLGLGIQAAGGGTTTSLFANKIFLLVRSTTLLANPHCHNLVFHTNVCRATFLASSKQSSGLCHTSCLKLGHSFCISPPPVGIAYRRENLPVAAYYENY